MSATARKLPTNLRTPAALMERRPFFQDFDAAILESACHSIGLSLDEITQLMNKLPDKKLPTTDTIIKALINHPIDRISPIVLMNAYANELDNIFPPAPAKTEVEMATA